MIVVLLAVESRHNGGPYRGEPGAKPGEDESD
jgi:hypothetical protein